jgi:hypothetical protein
MIDYYDEIAELDYTNIFHSSIMSAPLETSTPTTTTSHFKIEEITNDELDTKLMFNEDNKLLQPEADQESFISDYVSSLLSKSSNDYSLTN